MFKKILNKLSPSPQPVPAAPATPAPQPEGPRLSRTCVFGSHLYRRAGEDSTVYFTDESRGIRRMLVDYDGNIQDFPGIHREDFWVNDVPARYLQPLIRFRTDFVKRNGRFAMLWQVNPDGLYWGDDGGFGVTCDEEIILWAQLDDDGRWDGPFRLYSIGGRKYAD